MKKITLLISLIVGISSLVFSQNRTYLKLVSELTPREQKKIIEYKIEHADSLSAGQELKKLIFNLWEHSYLLATSDTVYKDNDTLYAFINIGPSWGWSKLKPGNVPNSILSKSSYKEKLYSNTLFRYYQVARLEKEVITYSEENGYPFASIGLDSIKVNDNRLEACLKYRAGPFITFDSVQVLGKTKIKAKFLARYLRILPGQPFNQSKINTIDKLLKELPYIKQTRPYAIIFDRNKAVVQLFLEDRRSNQIDGIIGFLPNQNAQKKLLLTGELNVNLKNLFGTGKSLGAEWKKFNQASQLLNLSYFHPRIINSNLDVKADFNLLKQDTSFINISRKLTIAQSTNKYGRLNFQGGIKTSRELIGDKISDKSNLPPFSSYNYYIYGLGYDWNNLDDYFYPHKGWSISFQGLIGNKTILKSAGYDDSLYSKIQLKSVQVNVTLTTEKFFRIGRNSTLLTRVEGGHIFNNQNNIFFNDMFRVGGLKSLRGFNENNFYALSYGLGTIEYRFFTDATSYLLLFFDQAYIRNPLNTSIPSDYPFGFGAGITFSTNVGIFSFVYSLGNAKSQPLNFNLSKIHFGMVSRF